MGGLDIVALINMVTERRAAFSYGKAYLRSYHWDHFSVYDAASDKMVNVTKEGVCEQCKDQVDAAAGKCTDNNDVCKDLLADLTGSEECLICINTPPACDHAKCTHPILNVPAIVADLRGFTGMLNLKCPY